MTKLIVFSLLLLQSFVSHSLSLPKLTTNFLINLASSGTNNDHLIQQEIKTRTAKLMTFSGLTAEIESVDGGYLVKLAIGTPAVPFLASPTTVTNLIWTQCEPCEHCFNQTTPIYSSSNSSSFLKLPCAHNLCKASYIHSCNPDCRYKQRYIGGSSEGVMGTETFTIGNNSVPGIAFGCGNFNTFVVSHGSGVVGLGRGPQSLVYQLGIRKFSYCLPHYDDESNGRLLLGYEDEHQNSIQSTPLVLNPSNSSFYYLTLHGITVGSTRLLTPEGMFKVRKDGGGGVIINTGSMFTALEQPAFGLLKDEFKSQLKLPFSDQSSLGYDACFSFEPKSNVEVPKLIYHFDGADLELPVKNYMAVDSQNGLLCLVILEATGGLTIFGGIHQSNINMMLDLEREVLSFVPAQCKQL